MIKYFFKSVALLLDPRKRGEEEGDEIVRHGHGHLAVPISTRTARLRLP